MVLKGIMRRHLFWIILTNWRFSKLHSIHKELTFLCFDFVVARHKHVQVSAFSQSHSRVVCVIWEYICVNNKKDCLQLNDCVTLNNATSWQVHLCVCATVNFVWCGCMNFNADKYKWLYAVKVLMVLSGSSLLWFSYICEREQENIEKLEQTVLDYNFISHLRAKQNHF